MIKKARFAILAAATLIITACSSIKIDENSKKVFSYETTTRETPQTLCLTNPKTKQVICTSYSLSETQISREVSVANAKNGGDCYLIINGPIDARLRDDIFKGIAELSGRTCYRRIAALNSPGGDVKEAMNIGRRLRQADFITIFDSSSGKETRCASACTLIFISGIERIATESLLSFFDSKMGFHKWKNNDYGKGLCTNEKEMVRALRSYADDLLDPKAAQSFIHFTLQAECTALESISASSLVKNKIATGTYLGDSERRYQLDGKEDGRADDGQMSAPAAVRIPVVPNESAFKKDYQRKLERDVYKRCKEYAEEEREKSIVEATSPERYAAAIRRVIQRCLVPDLDSKQRYKGTLNVIQGLDGQVLSVKVQDGDPNGRLSLSEERVVRAVEDASPLPLPSDRTLFRRHLRLEIEF